MPTPPPPPPPNPPPTESGPTILPAHAAAAPAPDDAGVVERLRDYAARADGESRAFLGRQPLVAVAAGLAAGALLGWLVKR